MRAADNHEWTGWKARLYAMLHRSPASNTAVADWAKLEPGMRVLDIGCGPGAAVIAAAPRIPQGEAIGVDPSPDLIHIARRRSRKINNVTFRLGAAESLPCETESFDMAWAVHSAHHWHHVGGGVGEARRVLRPDGRLLVVERHGGSWGITTERANSLGEALGVAGFVDIQIEERSLGRSREFVIHGAAP